MTSFSLFSFANNPSKVDIMSNGEKQGFRVKEDCALAEKYVYKSCTHIPRQVVYCTSLGEKQIDEKTDCSGLDVVVQFENISKFEKNNIKAGQGLVQRKVSIKDFFRMQQQQQQQESRN